LSALVAQAIDTIIANTIAVVEGTGSYTGIPGVYSHHPELEGASPSNLLITATSASTTVGIGDNTRTWEADKWTRTRAPSFWALCVTATRSANVDAARKIGAWAQATTMLTVGAFPANITAADTFRVLEGFRSAVDGNGEDAALDRRFTVAIEPGKHTDFYGLGYQTVRSTLVLTLSLVKAGKVDNARRSAVANAEILRYAVAKPAHWESTYTRAIVADQSEVAIDETLPDRNKVTIKWPILYRMAQTFL